MPPSILEAGEVDGANGCTGTALSMILAVVALGIGFLVVRATGRSVQK